MARSYRRKKNSLAGFWVLESIVVIAFSALLMNAQAIRETTTAMQSETPSNHVSLLDDQSDEVKSGWENHRPRFSQVVGELWNGGF